MLVTRITLTKHIVWVIPAESSGTDAGLWHTQQQPLIMTCLSFAYSPFVSACISFHETLHSPSFSKKRADPQAHPNTATTVGSW